MKTKKCANKKMENSKLYNELRDAEMSAAEERRRKAFARRQQRAALIGSAVAAVATAAAVEYFFEAILAELPTVVDVLLIHILHL